MSNQLDPGAVERVLSILRFSPSGLVTDIDGTISKLAPTPSAAIVEDRARAALDRLSRLLQLVAVVTGRSAANGQGMLGLDHLYVVGNHGMEWRRGGDHWVNPEAIAGSERLRLALAQIRQLTAALGMDSGLVFEDKTYSGSVHYRLAPDPDAVRGKLLYVMAEVARKHDLRITEGLLVVELRLPVEINKGTALVELADRERIDGLVFAGDDVTDLDAFHSIRSRESTGRGHSLSIAVVHPASNPTVPEAADVVVHGVDECVELFSNLADEIERRGRC